MANFIVSNTDDSGEGSLRQAILDANASAGADTITFTGSVFTDATPDTITLTSGELVITDDVTIEGTGENQLTVSGNNASRVFNIVNSGTDATIDDLTIANGNGVDGGGIRINSGASLVLTDSTVSNNNSGGGFGGAGIANFRGTLNVINSTISGNTSTLFGGGIASQGTLNVTNSTISGNTAGITGGGVIEGGVVTFTSSIITNNTAGSSGGGLAVFFGTTTTQDTIIAGNTAPQGPDVSGGTVQVNYSATTDEDNVFNANFLTNDTDPDTDVVLTVSEVNGNAANVGNQITLLSGALLTLNSDGSYNYNPNGQFESLAAGATANDSFTYTISYSNFTSTGTANLTINGVNDAATITGTATAAVTEDTNVVNGDLTATGNLSVSDVDTGENIFNTNVTSATGNLGSLSITQAGAYSYTVTNSAVQYLGAGVTKTDTFTVSSIDGTASQDIVITINGVNDAATITGTATAAVTEDTNVTNGNLTATGNLSVSDVDNGENIFKTNVTSATGNLGSLSITQAGDYTYTVANSAVQYLGAGVTKTDTFAVSSIDGTATQDITITINGVNDAPVAVDDSVSTFFATTVNIAVSTLLANDTDVDSTSLSITGVSGATNGTAVLNNNGTANNTADDFVSFTPNLLFTGNASFNYTLSDGSLTDTATVTVAVGLNIFGTNFADYLTGTSGNDYINGGNSNDTIYGGAGHDSLDGGNGNDILYGDGLMDGGAGNDTLNGGNGNDTAYGGAGVDYLNGGNGSDLLYGGTGSDILTGNNGNDIFAFAAGEGTDTITDFSDGNDLIGLYGGLSFGQLSFSGNNILVTSTSEILAQLTGVNTTTLTAADFVNL